jgi:hypothetical protein
VWQPLLLTALVAIVLGLLPEAIHPVAPYSIFRVMSAETYFRSGRLPWAALFGCVGASAAMLYGAAINLARRDF